MTILLEINATTATSKDWAALAAFTAVMRGTPNVAAVEYSEDSQDSEDSEDSEVLPSEKLMAGVEAARAAGAEIDVNGLPWDGRIHASTKTTTKDGAWTSKRGVQPDLVASVTAELLATMSAPAAPDEVAPPPPPPPFVTVAPGPVPVSVIAPVEAAKTPFAGIIEKIVQLKASGACDDTKIKMICDALGIPGVMALNARPDLVPQFCALLDN